MKMESLKNRKHESDDGYYEKINKKENQQIR